MTALFRRRDEAAELAEESARLSREISERLAAVVSDVTHAYDRRHEDVGHAGPERRVQRG